MNNCKTHFIKFAAGCLLHQIIGLRVYCLLSPLFFDCCDRFINRDLARVSEPLNSYYDNDGWLFYFSCLRIYFLDFFGGAFVYHRRLANFTIDSPMVHTDNTMSMPPNHQTVATRCIRHRHHRWCLITSVKVKRRPLILMQNCNLNIKKQSNKTASNSQPRKDTGIAHCCVVLY
jgi:hypothetical protein